MRGLCGILVMGVVGDAGCDSPTPLAGMRASFMSLNLFWAVPHYWYLLDPLTEFCETARDLVVLAAWG